MYDIAWTAVGALLIAATLMPLLKLDDWWVRIFDFPRLQLSVALLLTLVATLWFRQPPTGWHWLYLGAMGACLAYQLYRMAPYTPLWPRQVENSHDPRPDRSVSLLCANVLMSNHRADDLLALIRRHDPDLVLAAESDAWWQKALTPLEHTHPHMVRQAQDNTYGLLLYSRLPLRDASVKFLVEDDVPSIHARVVLPCGEEVALRCLHPRPPAPGESSRSTERDAELLMVGKEIKAQPLPAIVCGDLNDVAWSRTTALFRTISGLLDPRVGRGFFHTFNAEWPFLRFPLDHFFHSSHFRLAAFERLPYWGSDHFPVFIRLSFEPQAEAVQQEEPAMRNEKEEAQEKIDKV